MLYTLGPIAFEVAPLNAMEVIEEGFGDFARKNVIGARRPHEPVGEGDESITIVGRLFPETWGGLTSLELLQAIRKRQSPQLLIRGDGKVLGFVVIREVAGRSNFLDEGGVGRLIDFDIVVEPTDAPSGPNSFFDLFSLLS